MLCPPLDAALTSVLPARLRCCSPPRPHAPRSSPALLSPWTPALGPWRSGLHPLGWRGAEHFHTQEAPSVQLQGPLSRHLATRSPWGRSRRGKRLLSNEHFKHGRRVHATAGPTRLLLLQPGPRVSRGCQDGTQWCRHTELMGSGTRLPEIALSLTWATLPAGATRALGGFRMTGEQSAVLWLQAGLPNPVGPGGACRPGIASGEGQGPPAFPGGHVSDQAPARSSEAHVPA